MLNNVSNMVSETKNQSYSLMTLIVSSIRQKVSRLPRKLSDQISVLQMNSRNHIGTRIKTYLMKIRNSVKKKGWKKLEVQSTNIPKNEINLRSKILSTALDMPRISMEYVIQTDSQASSVVMVIILLKMAPLD